MESENISDNEIIFDNGEVARMVVRLLNVHGFGDWRVFFDDEPAPESAISFETDNTPPWIIHREDLEAISAFHRQLVKDISAADVPAEHPEKSESFVIFLGGCIVSKVIILIHCLLLSYNYYKVKTIPYPGRTASSYLNPEIVPDLKDALALAGHILFRNRNEHPYLRTQIIGQLYAMMKILFDVLAGMLPCDEVVRLREAYDQFHNSDGRFGTFDEFLDRLRAVSRRFAAEEPKWERERAMSPYTNPAPVVPKAEAFSSFASAGKRPRKQIPVKVAAAIFEVHENTINNWDKGKGRPKEYLGREVGEAALREAADTYFLRRRNEEQAKKNRAAGLTHQSREPKSPFGPDSSRREYDSGNFIGTKNGDRRPV